MFYEGKILGELKIELDRNLIPLLPLLKRKMTDPWWDTCKEGDIELAIKEKCAAGGKAAGE